MIVRLGAAAAAVLVLGGAAFAQTPDRYRIDVETTQPDGARFTLFTDTGVGGRSEVSEAGPGRYALITEISRSEVDGEPMIDARIRIARAGADGMVELSEPRLTFRPGDTASMTVETQDGPLSVTIRPAS